MKDIKISEKAFLRSVLAQSDDCDCQESGWVAFYWNEKAYLARYSHCSCYDTFYMLSNGAGDNDLSDDKSDDSVYPIQVVWEGTLNELFGMAYNCSDPDFPGRKASEDDSDYDHLTDVYRQLNCRSSSIREQVQP
jgi:hypothetical protein